MSTAQRYVPYAFARDHGILLRPAGDREAEAWVTDATPLTALNEVMRVFPGKVTPVLVEPAALREAIAQTYAAAEGSAQQIVGDIEGELDIGRMMAEVPDIEDLLETEDDAPIIRMINALLTQAARDGASDIHIEAFETYSLVRFRVDGTLRDISRMRPTTLSNLHMISGVGEAKLRDFGQTILEMVVEVGHSMEAMVEKEDIIRMVGRALGISITALRILYYIVVTMGFLILFVHVISTAFLC